MIRYQPKALNPYFVRKLTNHFIANMATAKETTQPTPNKKRLSLVAHFTSPFIISYTSRIVAPAIVGTARKNENSAAFLRVSLFAMPPTMVDIERLIPGMTERHWNKPMERARLGVTSFSSLPLLNILSQNNIKIPPSTSVMATTQIESNNQSSKPLFLAAKPTTTAGYTPMTSNLYSRHISDVKEKNFFQYKQTTERIAPN